jgi:hypothetical protein
MNEKPMVKVPQHVILATIDTMLEEIKIAHKAMFDAYDKEKGGSTSSEIDFIYYLEKVRVLSDEILRWKLL